MNDNSTQRTDEQAYRIAQLVAGYIRKKLTPAEHDELDRWVEASDENMRLFEELTDEKNIEANLKWMDEVQVKERLKKAKEGLVFAKPKRGKNVFRYSIAAAVILLIGSVIVIQQMSKNDKVSGGEVTAENILPASPGVTLRLSDGSTINLSEVGKGEIKEHASSTGDGLLSYNDTEITNAEILMHQLSTSTGGQYKLVLSDGSKVWLNAQTKLEYPAVFNTAERTVVLDGEAYFEVAKDNARPFTVKMKEGASVNVLGTHFNVQSYSDEDDNEVTLTEGSVAVTKGSAKEILLPGDMVMIHAGNMKVTHGIDTDAKLGWKDNLFVFRDADITAIMRQVARWYNIEVKYEGTVKDKFTATINRQEPLSKLLRLLELTGKIHFNIKNKVIHVHQ